MQIQIRFILADRDILDEDVPKIAGFSHLVWSLAISFDVIFIFSSIFLIVGVAAERRYLLLPWLVTVSMSILLTIILVLAAMFGLGNSSSAVVLLAASPFLAAAVYFWIAVYSTFHHMNSGKDQQLIVSPPKTTTQTEDIEQRQRMIEEPSMTTSVSVNLESTPDPENQTRLRRTGTQDSSSSQSSLGNNSNISAPPPYDTVADDITKEHEAIAAGIEQADLIYRQRSEIKQTSNKRRSEEDDDELIQVVCETEAHEEDQLINLLSPDESLKSTSIEISASVSTSSSRRGSNNASHNSTQIV